ncbi:DUF2325 domain-containing protein [Brevibacillus sp. B_LB10_24]|uniref:DUF2325 domain-containing protein n=1 Tax=Brevibacillus sp. B_LB10_24 TaxID=3380645 RepID=UPI0038BCB5D6
MPSLLIVGADHLGKISERFGSMGFERVIHISGRKSQSIAEGFPEHVSVVLVLTDYVNHNLSKAVKQKAKERGVPIYFAKRSWSNIRETLGSIKELQPTAVKS